MTSALAIEDEDLFDASEFDLNIPQLVGRASSISTSRFSGSAALDRPWTTTWPYSKPRGWATVRLIVVGEVGGKGFRLARNKDGEAELSYSCTVRVLTVEAGEIAGRRSRNSSSSDRSSTPLQRQLTADSSRATVRSNSRPMRRKRGVLIGV